MSDTRIKSITYLGESRSSQRQLKLRLSNGATVRAAALYESWQQWGAGESDLYITMPIVEAHNEWLHGGEWPQFTGA
jgi:hypothetical protein